MFHRNLLPMLMLAIFAPALFAQDRKPTTNPTTLPASEKFHIYILMGQSNMVGRDTRELASQVENPRVLAMNGEGQWLIAKEPMHVGGTGIGPGIPFALEMLKDDPSVTIGLVPCAVGGSSLSRWGKGAELYEKAVARAKSASQVGTLKGVLWHQGESDTSKKENAESYSARLAKMFVALRQDLGESDLPIVVGQLGTFLTEEKYPFAQTVRDAIKQMPTLLPKVGYADAAGLEDKGDKLHFSAAAERQFGARFSAVMLQLQGHTEAPAPAATLNVWPEGKMPGRGASEGEADLPARGDKTRRVTNVSTPTLSFFPAPRRETPAPAMIVCPGGGYSYCVVDKEGSEIAAWLNANGISAVVLKYRVPNNRAGALQDVQRAISLTRTNAAEWNIDTKRLGVIGFSAGGHLSATASTRFNNRAYPAIDEVDQQSCRPDFAVLVYPAYLGKEGKLSADLPISSEIPPTLIVHSEDDKKFNEGSKLYDASLTEAKLNHQFLFYRTGGHGYGLRCTREAKVWPEDAMKWFEKIGVK